MRFDRRRRWIAIAAGLAVLLVVALLVLTRDDGNDVATVAGPGSTTTTTTTVSPSTTTTAVAAPTVGSVTTVQAAATTTRQRATPPASSATTAPSRACAAPATGSDFAGFGASEVTIANADGSHRNCLLVAETEGQRQQGLMNQDDLDGYDGMLFRFPDEAERYFWMRNTRIPLSIAFYSANGSFVSATDMQPCGDSPDCPNYPSRGPAKYALEVLKGGLPGAGATAGSRLLL